jgi:calcineurin-like phosphoesterase family protein
MLYAIGDIHGMRDELARLLARMPLQKGDRLLFIGDYVDRGPNPKGVVDDLIALQKSYDCIHLMGNHEAMFLAFLGWQGPNYFGAEAFLHNGGETTLASYGYFDRDSDFALEPEHERFFKNLQLWHLEGEYAFVHAGLSKAALGLSDAKYALSRETARDLLWQRETADLPHSLGVTVIYGHTPLPDFGVRWNLPYSIGIDTGAVYGGPLTAIRLPDETIFQS